jgi:hypothetical protein
MPDRSMSRLPKYRHYNADFRGRPTCLFRTQCFPEIARFSLNFSAFEVRVMSPV